MLRNKYLQGLETGFYLGCVEDNAQDIQISEQLIIANGRKQGSLGRKSYVRRHNEVWFLLHSKFNLSLNTCEGKSQSQRFYFGQYVIDLCFNIDIGRLFRGKA